MVWPLFPSDIPITVQARQSVEATTQTQRLGDGYTYSFQFGLHPIEESWRLSIYIKPENLHTLLIFLEERAIDGMPFSWIPPDADPSMPASVLPDAAVVGFPWLWSVDQWPTPRTVRGRVAVDVVLRRRFDHVMEEV
jgi:phage-related protein